MKQDIASSYDGSNATFRLLRAYNWGPMLMNLGYFRWRGPLTFINWFTDISLAQLGLAARSIDLLDVRPGQRVLDVACGRGKSSFMIRQMHPDTEVVGLDLLPENMQIAQIAFGNTDGLSYQQGDAARLDFEDDSFDRVMCLEAAFHFPDRPGFLQECRRVLRPGGSLVVVDLVWTSDAHRTQGDPQQLDLLRKVWQWDDLYSKDDYRREAERAGLHLADTRDWTAQVTTPLLSLFSTAAWLGNRRWGRQLLGWLNPLARSISDEEWQQVGLSATAHRQLRHVARYVAMTFTLDESATGSTPRLATTVGEQRVGGHPDRLAAAESILAQSRADNHAAPAPQQSQL